MLFLGISALVGGIGRPRQTFNQASASLLSTMLFLVVIAILLPAVFDLTERITTPGANISLIDERLSLGVSVVLLLTYAAGLVYTLFTHRRVFAGDAPSSEAEWSVCPSVARRGADPARLPVGRRLWPIADLCGATLRLGFRTRPKAFLGISSRLASSLRLNLPRPGWRRK